MCNVSFFDGHGESITRNAAPVGSAKNLVFFTGR